jgi:adenylate cyclase
VVRESGVISKMQSRTARLEPLARRGWLPVKPRSITVTLAVSSGVLVALAVVSVLVIGVDTNRRNTLDLLNEKAELIVRTIDSDIESYLDPAGEQLTYLAARLADTVDPADKARVADLLLGALAAVPQIQFLAFWDSDLQQVAVVAAPDETPGAAPKVLRENGRERPATVAADAELREADGPFWGEPVFNDGRSFINLRQPVRRDGAYIGFLVAAVSVPELSEFVTRAGDLFDATAFILYGRDNVLAHPNLVFNHPDLSPENPMVRRDRIGDLVLANLWSGVNPPGFKPAAARGVDVELVTVGSVDSVVLYRWIDRYGAPWALGAYFPAEDLTAELLRLINSLLGGLAVLAIAIVLAVLLGRRIAQPIRDAATGAALIGKLDLRHVEPLKPSHILELNDQARAFNAMLAALRWFETYVPRSLVMRLLGREEEELQSVERQLTVMFTDIVGFTPRSERLPASETAAFLNDHFALLATCIEAEDGTIDKFIGDALMAFWGAPDEQPDHALRACRAGQAIIRAIDADNARREAAGQDPVRLRVGIHTGAMTVGNIGAPGRMNYTVVGDAVNTAQRLEALGVQFAKAAAVVVLISGTTAAMARDQLPLTEAGSFEVKGRAEPIEVFRLLP